MAPDRRRALPALLFLLLSILPAINAAVLGLDFGTLNLKATLVKPGIPLEIVLTKDSKRKEAAAVAFKPTRDGSNNVVAEVGTFPERLYGPDALALQGRLPGEVFPNLKPLLGLTGGDDAALEAYGKRYPAVQAQRVPELGTTVFKSSAFHDSEMPWSVEELLAMELASVRRNAEAMAGGAGVIEDAVVTVPVFYTADERRAVQKAAELAGLNVMSLVSDGLAVGLDYAKSRTFADVGKEGGKPEFHVVYDMGAGSTTATLLRFQGKSVKDVGKYNKTVQEVTVLGTGWDRSLGGDALNQVIMQDYIYKFLTKPVMKSRGVTAEEIGKNGRLMSRVWKEAEKARQVLSANTETHSSFEELLPEVDFKTKLTRADFEGLSASFADRVDGPLKDALAAAKLTLADLDSVILHGGAVRTPFVQKKLEELVGKSTQLRSNVNADETAVFGAAFKAASLSPSFKVKEIRDSDVAGYAAGITYKDGGKDRRQGLFSATSPVGHGATTKQVSFKNKEDFEFGMYQQIDESDHPIATVRTSNLTDSVKALKDRFGCEKEDVSTKFSVRLSSVDGLSEIVGGTVSCETEAAAKGMGDSVKDWLGFGKKKDQEPLGEGSDGTDTTEDVDASTSSTSTDPASSSSSTSASSSTSKAPEKPKKRTESINVAFTLVPQGLPQPALEELKRMRERLAAFDASDKARYAREEALNVLEAFTYYTRDFLDNTDFAAVSTAPQREEIAKLLESTREWMEQPGELAKATESVLREKLKGLKELVTPIQSRRKENEARPEKVKALKESLTQTGKLVDMVKEQVAKADEASSKASSEAEASESAASASSAASPSTSAPSADNDDLDDDAASSSSTTTTKPKPTPSAFSPYTNADLSAVRAVYDDVSAWLEEKEAAQSKLQAHEDPSLSLADLEAKADKLSSVMLDLVQKKARTPPRSSSSSSKKSKSKTSKTKKSKGSKSTATESGEGGSVTDAPEAEVTEGAEEGEKGKGKGPKILTMNGEDGVPSEEEILRMVREAKDEDGVHDEL